MPLLAIVYNYNKRNVLSYVATEMAGSTMLGIIYLLKYTDQFSNVSIRPVSRPLLVSKFFGSVNEVGSHNKSHQLYLALEKFWVTQCGCI